MSWTALDRVVLDGSILAIIIAENLANSSIDRTLSKLSKAVASTCSMRRVPATWTVSTMLHTVSFSAKCYQWEIEAVLAVRKLFVITTNFAIVSKNIAVICLLGGWISVPTKNALDVKVNRPRVIALQPAMM